MKMLRLETTLGIELVNPQYISRISESPHEFTVWVDDCWRLVINVKKENQTLEKLGAAVDLALNGEGNY